MGERAQSHHLWTLNKQKSHRNCATKYVMWMFNELFTAKQAQWTAQWWDSHSFCSFSFHTFRTHFKAKDVLFLKIIGLTNNRHWTMRQTQSFLVSFPHHIDILFFLLLFLFLFPFNRHCIQCVLKRVHAFIMWLYACWLCWMTGESQLYAESI